MMDCLDTREAMLLITGEFDTISTNSANLVDWRALSSSPSDCVCYI